MLFFHGFLMPTCETGEGERRYWKARGEFKKAQQKRKADAKYFAKKGGYYVWIVNWQNFWRHIEKK